MKTIYLVWGCAGEYDDFREWTVAAYEQESEAVKHMQACIQWNDENWRKSGSLYLTNPYDPESHPARDNEYWVSGMEVTDKFAAVV